MADLTKAAPPTETAATNANDAMVDLLYERAIDLLRLEAGTRDKVLYLLDDLEKEIVAAVAAIDPTGPARAKYQRDRLIKLQAEVESSIRATYRTSNVLLGREIRDVIDTEATWTANAINSSVQANFADAGLTRTLLDTLVSDVLIQGAPTKEWWERQAGGLADAFADQMRLGVAIGDPLSKMIDRVRGTATQRGIMDISRFNAERLIRSSVQTAANTARTTVYEQNADLIKALGWSATLDTRTSIMCMVRNGHQYGVTDHEALDDGPPWLEGPGKLHWGALVEGTLVHTDSGPVAIEKIALGDLVLTHIGNWRRVTAKRAKRLESGIVRIVHTQSGRILRATDDHPVRLSNGSWVFVGALEVGDDLLCDSESVSKVVRMHGSINTKSEDCPTVRDETRIAIERAFKLVAPGVDFESNPEFGYRKIENRAIEMILRNPSAIDRDQSIKHHLFATAHALAKLGCERLSDLLALHNRNLTSGHAESSTFIDTGSFFGFERAFQNAIHLGRVVLDHALGVFCQGMMRFLGQTPRPVFGTDRRFASTGIEIGTRLLGLVSNRNAISLGVARQTAIGQAFGSFDITKRSSETNVFSVDKHSVARIVNSTHGRVIALETQTYKGNVYDLEVETDASYIANGIVVSNCRSTSIPILKSWRDIGIDADEVPETTRASMDGQVAASQSFEDWLKKQSAARQDTVLGQGRASLWRQGKITFRDLLDQNGRPLTTEQLRAKYASRSA